jgi:hypothetical protein
VCGLAYREVGAIGRATLELYDIIIIFVATVVVIMINIIVIVTKQITAVHSFDMEFFILNLFVTVSIHEVLVGG